MKLETIFGSSLFSVNYIQTHISDMYSIDLLLGKDMTSILFVIRYKNIKA